MATLKDIAKITGLSATTVSRALRGFDDVTPKTRDRVKEVALQLNYRPNLSARKLVSGRSGIVGLIFDSPTAGFEHAHIFDITHALSKAMAEKDLDLMLHVSSDADPLATYDRLIARGTMDGFVLLFPKRDDPRIAYLRDRDVPFVVHGKDVEAPDYPFVSLDSKDLTRRAVDHLAGYGHRTVALLNGPEPWMVSMEREAAYSEAVKAQGLVQEPDLIRCGDTSQSYGRAAALCLLRNDHLRPTAFVCCNSLVAFGVLEAVAGLGLSVPGDISIVAHDDILPGVDTENLDPPLSVTRLAVKSAATILAGLLLRRLNGESAADMQVLQKAEWVERSSVGPAKSC